MTMQEKIKELRIELYGMTQIEKHDHIKATLKEKDIEFKELEGKGIWGVRFEGRPVFVSHLDTVNKSDDEFKKPLLIDNGRLSRPGYVLGADDTAGNAIMLNHIDDINFVFTWDEEIGCVGAKALAKNEEFIADCKKGTFFVELDRKNGNDLLGNKHGYCNKELADKLLAVLPDYKDASGVYTDIDSFTDIMQGVNLSVGYYLAHSKNEYLVIDEFCNTNSLIPEINKVEHERELPPVPVFKSYTRKTKSSYNFQGYGEKVCDCCGSVVFTTTKYKGRNICWTCKSYEEEHERRIIEQQEEWAIQVKKGDKCILCNSKITDSSVAYHIAPGSYICEECVIPVKPSHKLGGLF